MPQNAPGRSNKLHANGSPVGRRYARINDAAEYIDVNPFTIRKMITDGKIHAYRGGGLRLIRVDLNELDAVMAGGPGWSIPGSRRLT
jgi:excisionase family DNA binding protein